MNEKANDLVGNLIRLAKKNDLGALAALRSGRGKKAGQEARMFKYIAPFLRQNEGPAHEAAFLTGSLFATFPEHLKDGGSLAKSLSHAREKFGTEALEKRLVQTLDAEPEDLPALLTTLVLLCESAGSSINWFQFIEDVTELLTPRAHPAFRETTNLWVRTKWARDFWDSAPDSTEKTSEEETE